MVEQLRLEIRSRHAQDFSVFKNTHDPAPEPPGCRDQDQQSHQGDPAGAASGLDSIGFAAGARWRRGNWRWIGRVRAADRIRRGR